MPNGCFLINKIPDQKFTAKFKQGAITYPSITMGPVKF